MKVFEAAVFAVVSAIIAMEALTAVPAFGGDIFVRAGVALSGYDPVAYFTEGQAVPGSPVYVGEYQGATFRFASNDNRMAFLKDPVKFAPQYGGYCAYGTAKGYKAATDPEAFTIVDGKLYLNYDRGVQERWRADIPGYIRKADHNWPEVRRLTKIYE